MIVAFILIVIHFFADFVFQTEHMAINKSKNFSALIEHTSVYSTIWLIPIYAIIAHLKPGQDYLWYVNYSFVFAIITFIAHTATDYVTSKISSGKFARKEYYLQFPRLGAFALIGLDQVLHYAQLFLTLYYITK